MVVLDHIFDLMKTYLKGKNLRDFVLLTLGINSGLRISDLLKLKVEDVRGKDRITVLEQKTKKPKDFVLGKTSLQALAEYLPTVKGSWLFPSRKGDAPLQRIQAWRILNEAAQAVGITANTGTHTLRKTFGYHAYSSGVPLEVIQDLLNHVSPKDTLRYIGISRDDRDAVYRGLNL